MARAVERTRLSWRRTTLSATTVVAVGVFRLVLSHPDARTVAGVGLVALAWLGVLLLGQHRIGQLDRADTELSDAPETVHRGGPMRGLPVVLGLLVTLAALGALLVQR